VDTALNGNTPITVDPASTLTYSGTIRDRVGNSSPGASRGGITKDGEGTLVLSAGNSYTGDTTVLQGTLILGNGTNNSNLANEADVSVAIGATLQLNFTGSDTIDELTLGGVAKSPGTYNAANSGGFITGTGSLIVQNGPISDPFASWMGGYFPGETDPLIIGATADPDNDGLDNLLEYVLNGGNPSVSNPGILPTLNAAGTDFIFTFFRRADATGTNQEFQYGSNLSGWANVPITDGGQVAITPNNPSAGIDRVIVTIPKGTNTKLFGRLSVTK
jgi:autotransporter-associated beta strand protein